MVKEANRLSTTKRLIKALGGGHTGKSNLKYLQDTFKSMPPQGYDFGAIPNKARMLLGNLEHGLRRAKLLDGTEMSLGGIFSVLDPSGRLGYSRNLSRARRSTEILDSPRSIIDSWAHGHPDSAKDPFLGFIDAPGRVMPNEAGIVGPMRERLNGRKARYIESHGPNYARDFYNDAIDALAKDEGRAIPPSMYSKAVGRIARGRMDKIHDLKFFTPASVQMLPGEIPQAAVLRDLKTRLIPGTRLSSANGKSIIRNTPLGLSRTGRTSFGSIGMSAKSRVKDLVRATHKAEGLGTEIPSMEKLDSFASPLGVSTFAANNNGVISYAPNVLMHEFGHVYSSFPYFIRSSHIPGGPTVSGLRRAGRKGLRGYRTYDNRGYQFISDPDEVRKDPLRALRSMHPEMLDEINADVNAFGSDIGKWPKDIRVALGTYMASHMPPYKNFASKNIGRLGLKDSVLKYRDLSNAYVDALGL